VSAAHKDELLAILAVGEHLGGANVAFVVALVVERNAEQLLGPRCRPRPLESDEVRAVNEGVDLLEATDQALIIL